MREHSRGIAAQAFEHDLGTNDRLDALAAGLAVELDGGKQVAEQSVIANAGWPSCAAAA